MEESVIKKYLAIALLLLGWIPLQLSAQRSSNPLEAYQFDLETTGFLTVKKEGLQFYDNLIQRHGLKAVSKEGSPYRNFLKFLDVWEERLSPYDYNYIDFYESTGVLPKAGKKGVPTPTISTCAWKEVGPITPSSGYGEWIAGIGHTEFIRIARFNPDRMLAGSIHGGLFYSSDAGQNWTCVSDEWDISGCSWAEFSENNPGQIIATTSDGQNNNTSKATGMSKYGGIMVSNDYGQTWTKLLSGNTISVYSRLNKVVYPPGLSNEFYIAMKGGLYHYNSTTQIDNAAGLTLIEDFAVPISFVEPECLDIEIIRDPILFPQGNFMAVTVRGLDSTGSNKVFKSKAFVSTNGGNSFTEVFANIGLKSACTFESSRFSLQNQSTLSQAVIHFNAQVGGQKKVFTLNLSTLAETQLTSFSDGSNFGGCFAFAVNDFDDKKIVASKGLGLRGTHDNFQTNPMDDSDLHDDIEHFIWHPNNPDELWVATHGGVEKSTDGGLTWQDMSLGLGVANINTFDDAPDNPSKVLLSLEHGGTVRLNNTYYQANANHDWVYFTGGDAYGAAIVETDELRFYFSSTQSASGTKYSTDYFTTSGSLGFNTGYSFNAWFEPSTDRRSIYTPGPSASKNDVYQSNLVAGQQPTRYAISEFEDVPGLNPPYRIRKIKASTADKDVLFVTGLHKWPGAGNKKDYFLLINRSARTNMDADDIKATWKEIIMPYDSTGTRNAIAFRDVVSSHYVKGRYYVVTTGIGSTSNPNSARQRAVYILQLNNNGTETLTDITGNLKNCLMGGTTDEAILVEKGTNEGLYLSMRCGVFYLHGDDIEAGNYNWKEVGTGLPNITKNGIKANYTINKIRLGTDGRGLWEGCFVCPDDVSSIEQGVSPSKFVEVTQSIVSTATIPATSDVKYRGGTKIDLEPGFETASGSEFRAFIHSCYSGGKNSFKSRKKNPWSADESLNSERWSQNDQDRVANEMNVYPNPAGHQLTFSVPSALEEDAHIRMVDMTGRVVKEWVSKFENESVTISDLEPGTYQVIIIIGDKQETFKVVKM